jgi:hypothetical protein
VPVGSERGSELSARRRRPRGRCRAAEHLNLFRGGSGAFLSEGNRFRRVGNPLAGNNADTTDDVLASYVLPASSFDVAGRGLCITAQGGTSPTTNNKRVKLWFNATISGASVTAGTMIADTGPWVNGTMPK